MSELTRESIENKLIEIRECRAPLAGLRREQFTDEILAIITSRDAERERVKQAEQANRGLIVANELYENKVTDLTAKLEVMTQERNEAMRVPTAKLDGVVLRQLAASEKQLTAALFRLAPTDCINHATGESLHCPGCCKERADDLTAKLAASAQRVKELEEQNPYKMFMACGEARQQLADAQATIADQAATIDAQCREAASLNQCITDLEAIVARLQAVQDALVDVFEGRESDNRHTLVQTAKAIQATVTAQQEEIGRLREVLRYYAGANISARAVEALAAKGGG